MGENRCFRCTTSDIVERRISDIPSAPIPSEPIKDTIPTKPMTCEDICASKNYQITIPDFSSYIANYLKGYSCVSGAKIHTKRAFVGDCTCYPTESPKIEVDTTPTVCRGTPCGDVPCNGGKSCQVGDTKYSVTCDWHGWSVKQNTAVPIVGG